MKINISQLETHVSKQLASIYVVSGEDLLQKNDAIQLIRKAARNAGFERTRLSAEVVADEEQFYSCLYAHSLLAEKRLLELDFRDSTLNKLTGNILKEYAEKPAEETILLVDIGKIDAKLAKTLWYKALEKSGIVIPVWPIAREQLPQWIHQRARKYKLQLNPDTANLLADYVEGNLIAAAQTLEKLYLLKMQKPIDIETIQTILSDESRFTVFDFIDSLIAGDKSRTLHILANLKEEGTEPVLVLWAITRELRLLADYARQIQEGCTYDQLFQKYRIFSRRQAPFRRFLMKFREADCWHHLAEAAHIDNIIKGAIEGNSWEALQLFCLRLL